MYDAKRLRRVHDRSCWSVWLSGRGSNARNVPYLAVEISPVTAKVLTTCLQLANKNRKKEILWKSEHSVRDKGGEDFKEQRDVITELEFFWVKKFPQHWNVADCTKKRHQVRPRQVDGAVRQLPVFCEGKVFPREKEITLRVGVSDITIERNRG